MVLFGWNVGAGRSMMPDCSESGGVVESMNCG